MLPNLSTQRLVLRERVYDDFEDCRLMDCDPLVTQFIPGPWANSKEHRLFLIERIEKSYPTGLGYWVVQARVSQQFLGWVFLLPHHTSNDKAEIGWRFNRASWGQGFATEAACNVLKYAFDELKLSSVFADIHVENTASNRVAEKLGMFWSNGTGHFIGRQY